MTMLTIIIKYNEEVKQGDTLAPVLFLCFIQAILETHAGACLIRRSTACIEATQAACGQADRSHDGGTGGARHQDEGAG